MQAFPEETAPRFLLRDRDDAFGPLFRRRARNLAIHELLTTPRSPWQNPYVERFIGSARRECLDHVVVLGERHLCRLMRDYIRYYNRYRTHLALDKDSPEGREVQPIDAGEVVAIPQVGGLHHRYERRAA